MHGLATVSPAIAATEKTLSPNLRRAVQILCDTYDAIDLRIETTLGKAENDFVAALPEVQGCDEELRELADLLIEDVRNTLQGQAISTQPLLLRFTYQDQNDLVTQLVSSAKARVVVVPVGSDVSLHAV